MARICILLPAHWDAARGGSEFRARCLAEYLAANTRHEVTYLARYVPDDVSAYPYRIRRFQGPRAFASLRWGMSPDAPALYRALRDIDPDLIVQLVASAYTGVAAYFSRQHGKPLFWCLASDRDVDSVPNVGIQGPGRFLDRVLFRYGARHATQVIAQTANQASQLRANHGREALAVVPNFHPEATEPLTKSGDFRVLWVSNLKTIKQPEHFLHLAEEFTRYPDIRFQMIGRRENSAWCDTLLASAGRLPNFEYLGELSMDEVNRHLAGARVLVNTSIYEGLPNTLIQGWLREVPALTLNVDPDGVIESQRLGYRTGDPATLKDRLLQLYREPALLEELAGNSRRFAEATYSMRNLERIHEHLEHALDPEANGSL